MFIYTIGTIFGALVIFVWLVVFGVHALSISRKKSKCDHLSGVRENMACHAICIQCGKDLGFIGSEENKTRVRV